MVTVNSLSSGRSARNGVPPAEVTTTPSGPAIRSSCRTAPLVVWKAPPGARTTEWRRPLGSVRVIRSPGSRGPRRTPLGGSATADAPQTQLPARSEGGRADLHAGPSVQVLVGLADRQDDQDHRALPLQDGEQPVGGVGVGRAAVLGLDG